jgi:tRNA (guanine-N7-)-methyltransferase
MLDTPIHLPNRRLLPDWQAIFRNANPLAVEIGPGRGDFLIERASAERCINFIGIEIRWKRAEKISRNIAQEGLSNAKTIAGDALEILPALFAPASITAFFVHFPDPWRKRRHQHHRLIQPRLIDLIHLLLIPAGKAYLTTDVESYAQTISQLFARYTDFDTVYSESGHRSYPYHHSRHEENFKEANRTLYYFCFCKKSVEAILDLTRPQK